jgi:UDP-N-acetyl-D-galactosamine dehydrogenase
VILAGRRINDGMGRYVATQLIKMMVKKCHRITDTKILVLGITFKENCPDIRNSRVIDVINQLKDFDCNLEVFDPVADPDEVRHEYGIDIITDRGQLTTYEGIVVAVAHDEFRNLQMETLKAKDCVVYDVKGIYPQAEASL